MRNNTRAMEETRYRLVHDLLCDFDESLTWLFFIRIDCWNQVMLSLVLDRTICLCSYMCCCDILVDPDQQEGIESQNKVQCQFRRERYLILRKFND